MTRLVSITCQFQIPLITVLLVLLGFPQSAPVQRDASIVVPLRMSRTFEPSFTGTWIEFDQAGANFTTKRKLGEVRPGRLPGGLRVTVETVAESPERYLVRIDTDGDRDLADETAIMIKENGPVKLNVIRKSGDGGPMTLPYVLVYERHPTGKQMKEVFLWRPVYAAEGVLRVGSCEAQVKVWDANGDGVFNRDDFAVAETLYIDDGAPAPRINLSDPRVIRHADGRLEIPTELRAAGKKKWLRGEEIIEVCNNSYLVDMIKPDGSALVLTRTNLRVPKVGEGIPELVLTAMDGKPVDLKRMRGKAVLIDFWASWCRPCVDKFPMVKKMVKSHERNLNVIAVNVDEADRLPMVTEIIKDHKLEWLHVASGLGQNDLLWKAFGSMVNNGLNLPLYVLIDSNGIIKYAGNGGENLAELSSTLKESVSPPG